MDADDVIAELRTSKRYGGIAEPTLRRVAESALAVEGGRIAPAAKRAKRALHEVYGAYLGPSSPPYQVLEQNLREAAAAGEPALREALMRAMRHHSSTRERAAILERFYATIFERTGVPRTIADIAAGLNPLAAPWMGLGPGTTYIARDIDMPMMRFVDAALTILAIDHDVGVADALVDPPPPADISLLLKAIPCLERQRRSAGFDLVDALEADVVVTSFPTASLGGLSKGLAKAHLEQFRAEAGRRGWRYDSIEFPGELALLVWK